MKASMRRKGVAAVAAAGLVSAMIGLGGCARIRAHQGYVMDKALVASIAPGVDNRQSVQKTLGDPSFASQFDSSTWYYLSRSTRQFSFGLPKATDEKVLAVHFDPAGNVSRIDRTGLEQAVSINPVKDKTPTLGRKRSLLQELFGNIGAVGSAATTGPTADNPGGSSGGSSGG